MHGGFEQTQTWGLSHDSILQLDRALRRARERVFKAGALSGAHWVVLVELAGAEDGQSFDSLEAGPVKHLGRPMLLACLSNLQEAGLIEGLKETHAPLLSHVRITPEGQEKIREVLDAALVIVSRRK